jgi:hypothetical protein
MPVGSRHWTDVQSHSTMASESPTILRFTATGETNSQKGDSDHDASYGIA